MSRAIAKIIRPTDLPEEVFAGADQFVRSTELPNTGCLVVRPNRLQGAGYKLKVIYLPLPAIFQLFSSILAGTGKQAYCSENRDRKRKIVL
jgi:hypothetical protein